MIREFTCSSNGSGEILSPCLTALASSWHLEEISHITSSVLPHLSTEPVKLSDAVVDFWCENLRRFAESQPLLGVVDRRAGY